jgi:hypothetical protein
MHRVFVALRKTGETHLSSLPPLAGDDRRCGRMHAIASRSQTSCCSGGSWRATCVAPRCLCRSHELCEVQAERHQVVTPLFPVQQVGALFKQRMGLFEVDVPSCQHACTQHTASVACEQRSMHTSTDIGYTMRWNPIRALANASCMCMYMAGELPNRHGAGGRRGVAGVAFPPHTTQTYRQSHSYLCTGLRRP